MSIYDHDHPVDMAWCPGCGNFRIIDIVKKTLDEMKLDRSSLVMVSGIGQAAKTPHYINCNFFDGLHGRALPAATAIKAANPGLTVIVESGDGCSYGEGGNHFIHAVRRNPDLTLIVHNNMVYGLTKGQASPTSMRGFTTPVQISGVYHEPFNPLAVAVSLNAAFVARAYCGDPEETKRILKAAIRHRGFSLVDVFQPCVTFNRTNTYQWYKNNTYYLGDDHDPTDRKQAFFRSLETEKYPLGIFYTTTANKTFEENLAAYKKNNTPLYKRTVDTARLKRLIDSKT